jgi:hypothetical protein
VTLDPDAQSARRAAALIDPGVRTARVPARPMPLHSRGHAIGTIGKTGTAGAVFPCARARARAHARGRLQTAAGGVNTRRLQPESIDDDR